MKSYARQAIWSGASVQNFIEFTLGLLRWLPTNSVGKALIDFKPAFSFFLFLTYCVVLAYTIVLTLRKKDPETIEKNKPLPPRHALALTLSWLIVPPAALFILSYVWRPCFTPRYFIHSMLPAYMLMGAFFTVLNPRFRIFALTTLLVLNIGYQAAFHSPGPFRFRYEDATDIIAESYTEPERVLAIDGMDASAMRYRLYPKGIRVTRIKNEPALLDEFDSLQPNFTPFWMLVQQPTVAQRILAKCQENDRTCTLYDLSAALPLFVVHAQP